MTRDHESRARDAIHFLAKLRKQFEGLSSAHILKWLQDIDKLQDGFQPTGTIIGVVGATGAGKSALINALLREERIIPTSCMRACTAVVTEIAYGTSDFSYTAEIEFVSKEQWRSELHVLFGDLFDEQGKWSRNCYSEDSEAGIAYAKLKAVYSDMSRDMLIKASIEDLMSHDIASCLDTTLTITENDAAEFYKKLQVYIDSAEKVDLRHKSSKTSPSVVEYWPLIRVVRLKLKSKILQTGAVIVDLPGVHDSNAARAAVAQRYLQQCSGIVIIAPINRAVDDKSAKTLLGQSFKQQLKLDGNIGNVTFVCSMTDNINSEEIIDDLQTNEVAELQSEHRCLELAIAKLRDDKLHYEGAWKTTGEDLKEIEHNLRRFCYQLACLASKTKSDTSTPSPLKRKRSTSPPNLSQDPPKAVSLQNTVPDVYSNRVTRALNRGTSTSDFGDTNSREAVEAKIADLRFQERQIRDYRVEIKEKTNACHLQLRTDSTRAKAIREELLKICILERNEYARLAIKDDFAGGIAEVDQELADEIDPENFDPSVQLRDYQEIADAFPVFCVSSRAYQQLDGRLTSGKKCKGFTNFDMTEIPQLQEHISQIPEQIRVSMIERFLNDVAVLCTSLKLWTSDHSSSRNLTDVEMLKMDTDLRSDIALFKTCLSTIVEDMLCQITNDIKVNITDKFKLAVQKALSQALDIVRSWGRAIDRDNPANGGLHWGTYKAVTRRNGLFAKTSVTYDFNRDLAEPIINTIAGGWETVFVRRVPARFLQAGEKIDDARVSFTTKIRATAMRYGIVEHQVALLEQQVVGQSNALRHNLKIVQMNIKKTQRKINRTFAPFIEEMMTKAYLDCTSQSGQGSFLRMKHVLEKSVEESGQDMFEASTESVKVQLKDMLTEAQDKLENHVNHASEEVSRDYAQLSASRSQQILTQEKSVKDRVLVEVRDYEMIESIVALSVEQPHDEVSIKAEFENQDRVSTELLPHSSLKVERLAWTTDDMMLNDNLLSVESESPPPFDMFHSDDEDVAYQ